jgi:hypothetical protein
MIQRARHDKAKRAADRDLARAAAHFSGTANGNGTDSDRGSEMMTESPSRQALTFIVLMGYSCGRATRPHTSVIAEKLRCAGAKLAHVMAVVLDFGTGTAHRVPDHQTAAT